MLFGISLQLGLHDLCTFRLTRTASSIFSGGGGNALDSACVNKDNACHDQFTLQTLRPRASLVQGNTDYYEDKNTERYSSTDFKYCTRIHV